MHKELGSLLRRRYVSKVGTLLHRPWPGRYSGLAALSSARRWSSSVFFFTLCLLLLGSLAGVCAY
jgi:hypothetical protein